MSKIKEYLRLGRLFNAEILSLLYILSYLLSAKLYEKTIDLKIIFILFFLGILTHIWGCYNNDRLDLEIDKKAKYCSHKPLVTGSISIKSAKTIEYLCLLSVIIVFIIISSKISTISYLSVGIILAYLYNRYNKSNMFINIIGQMYATFFALTGMSVIIDFDFIVFLSCIIMGLNGVYLNIIEADIKDIEGDKINVPKSLGVRFIKGKVANLKKFYILNEVIKIIMYILVFYILYLEKVVLNVYLITSIFIFLNLIIRIFLFKKLKDDREKIKPFIALQELSSILFISMIYFIIHPIIPFLIIIFVLLWLTVWNKILWNTYLRPQV